MKTMEVQTPQGVITMPATQAEAKLLLAAHGMTMRSRDGEHRVNFKDGDEATASYTNDLEDAVNTGMAMRYRPFLYRVITVLEGDTKGEGDKHDTTLRAFFADNNCMEDDEVVEMLQELIDTGTHKVAGFVGCWYEYTLVDRTPVHDQEFDVVGCDQMAAFAGRYRIVGGKVEKIGGAS